MSKAIPNASKRLMRKLKKLEQHKKNVLIDRRAAALKAHGSDDDVAAAEIKVDKKRFSQDRDSKEFPAKKKVKKSAAPQEYFDSEDNDEISDEQPSDSSNETSVAGTTENRNSKDLSKRLPDSVPFSSLSGKVSPQTLKAIEEMGFVNMTAIQARSIPLLLTGTDLVAAAKTGSGKTLAFLVGAIEIVKYCGYKQRNGTGAIILSPNRELAMQTFSVLSELMKYHSNLTFGLLTGGAKMQEEARKLGNGLNIVVATPGRLMDHLQSTPDFVYKNVCFLVIDEADLILDAGFEEQLKQIIRLLPKRRKTMLFSATLTTKIEALTTMAMSKSPVYVGVGDDEEKATVDGLQQGFLIVPSEKRWVFLLSFLKKNRKKKVIVFFNSRKSVQYHHDVFNYIDLHVMCIHGSLDNSRRTNMFLKFSKAKSGIMLCTDVGARGVDIPAVDWIVQYDPPNEPRDYIHRVGRTARGEGTVGRAVLILRNEELPFLRYLHQARVPIDEMELSWDKILDYQQTYENLIAGNPYLKKLATDAYQAYIRSYASHNLKNIFNVETLDLNAVAKSFGFPVPPAVDLSNVFKNDNPQCLKKSYKSQSSDSFAPRNRARESR